jgi:hypothetical protein
MIPAEYLDNFRRVPTMEIIGDNGKTAVLAWNP